MKVLGITGGVGAGKSTVLAYLEERYGAKVIQADLTARRLQEPGEVCYEKIVETFGKEILSEDGSLNRKELARMVFSDSGKLETLNRLVHPYVKEEIQREIREERKRGTAPFIALEAALLLEDHYETVCDEIWYIYADPETRARRLEESRGYTPKKIRDMMANQLTEAQYREKCNFAIDNSGNFVENTYEQIDKGLKEHGFL